MLWLSPLNFFAPAKKQKLHSSSIKMCELRSSIFSLVSVYRHWNKFFIPFCVLVRSWHFDLSAKIMLCQMLKGYCKHKRTTIFSDRLAVAFNKVKIFECAWRIFHSLFPLYVYIMYVVHNRAFKQRPNWNFVRWCLLLAVDFVLSFPIFRLAWIQWWRQTYFVILQKSRSWPIFLWVNFYDGLERT